MMTRDAIGEKFQAMGARVRIGVLDQQPQRRWNGRRLRNLGEPVVVDVKRDARGEFFDVWHAPDVHVRILDVRRRDRHLLLGASFRRFGWTAESRFLCGRDEWSWFVAAIPEQADAMTVQAAKDALKPREVWD